MDCFHSWTGFIGLGVLFCFGLDFFFLFLPLIPFAAKDLDAYHQCTRTVISPWLLFFFFVLIRFIFHFCQRTSAFYSWSSILFILSDLYPFRYLVITLPCLKKRAYWKKRIKQLWFLKCTVVCLYSLCNAVILAVLDKRNRVNNTVHFVTDVTLLGPAPQLAVKITHGDQRAGGRESMISPLFTAFCWSWLQTGPNTF